MAVATERVNHFVDQFVFAFAGEADVALGVDFGGFKIFLLGLDGGGVGQLLGKALVHGIGRGDRIDHVQRPGPVGYRSHTERAVDASRGISR